MSHALERSLDWQRLCAGRKAFTGTLAVSRCSRLSGLLSGVEGDISYQLEFRIDENLALPLVEAFVSAPLQLTCQRCLQIFTWQLESRSVSQLVLSEAQAAEVIQAWEPVIVPPDGVVPMTLIEDECILGVPLAPSCGCALADAATDVASTRNETPPEKAPQADARPNPFAVLKQLKS